MNEHSQDLLWCPKADSHLLNPEICWQSAIHLQGQIQFVEVLSRHKSRIQLDWQHTEVALECVLQDVALAHPGKEGDDFCVLKFLHIDSFVDLCQSYSKGIRSRRLQTVLGD